MVDKVIGKEEEDQGARQCSGARLSLRLGGEIRTVRTEQIVVQIRKVANHLPSEEEDAKTY